MTSSLRSWIASLLVVALVLTGQTMAVTRGAAAATGQMELCIGVHVVTVYVDAQGNPTAAPHFCPDCAFAGLTALVFDPAWENAPCAFKRASLGSAFRTTLTEGLVRTGYWSRAPPVSF